MTAPRHWIAVASAEHALRGRDESFMQVCHGKAATLRRLRGGDVVAHYAPAQTMGGKDRLQSFVSIGQVKPGAPYEVDMGGGFVPFRRDIAYWRATAAPIHPLLNRLQLIGDRQRWGYKFRFGLFDVPLADMRLIAQAMQAGDFDTIFPDLPQTGSPAVQESATLDLFD